MQYQQDPRPHARLNNFHGTKRQLLGHQVQPAWKPNAMPASKLSEVGSKIFLSRLPVDVAEKEVEELFKKTVGPVKECFLIYNSQGKSKGMAIVQFSRATDAASARAKYNGKIVDGRRPLRIEIIIDDVPKASAPAAPQQPLTLLQRLGGVVTPNHLPPKAPGSFGALAPRPVQVKRPVQPKVAAAPRPVPVRRQPVKKGPKRLKKRESLTAAQLDQEMEDYRNSSPSEYPDILTVE